MEYSFQLQKLCLFDTKRWYLLIVGLVAVTYLMFQSSMLPYGNAIKSLLPNNGVLLGVKNEVLSRGLSVNLERKGETNSGSLEGIKEGNRSDGGVFNRSDIGFEESNRMTQDILSSEGHDQKEALGVNSVEESFLLESGNGGIEKFAELEHQISQNSSVELHGGSNSKIIENVERSDQANLELKKGSNIKVNEIVKSGNQANLELAENLKEVPLKDVAVLVNSTKFTSSRRRNKVKPGMPPISVIPIDEMNRRLAWHLMKPQWPSLRDPDMEIIDAKVKIINSPVSPADKELYEPVFRNVSKFIRSYELMEKTLKVYVYKDGRKPIFHQPILKGLYASEGWFMKLMEGNKHFLVKDPEKAHLFYMPFSSRMLEYALYVPGSHNRTKLRQFVKGYTETIAAKYPFWNRSGGADHFVVACHDWALYETRHHMENSIKALCNADVTIGFKIGRDVSLPETFIRYARNPLRELGGKPPSKRNILAFYAGNSHGYLRPTLLKHWEAKDPDMRIYGLLPSSVSKKMNYMQHMKSSKYCICPKGFEVNSPRVVEAIFYECVPVIISDNFVPPLFEVLNWEAFSVIVAEKDIPNLKTILLSIPEAKYMEMQLAVRKVQRHFLWHSTPVKYDLFHMTLHSIWNNRVFQIPRQ